PRGMPWTMRGRSRIVRSLMARAENEPAGTRSPQRPASSRRPVRREGAEHYLFLTLISFAGTVILTRSFLELTGYPRIGGGELLTALQLLEESVEGDLQEDERLLLRSRLESAARNATDAEQRRLASELLQFVESKDLTVVPDPPQRFKRIRRWWTERRHRWLGGRGLRVVLVAALFVSGAQAIVALGMAVIQVTGINPTGSTRLFSLAMLHLVLEAVAGILLIAGASLLLMPQRRRLGVRLSNDGLLVALTLADLASFYLRQFAAIETAVFHAALLAGVIGY